jgi:hypothetical protein
MTTIAVTTIAVDWRPGSLVSTVDGEPVRRIDQSPDYPVQLVPAVFDFPTRPPPATKCPSPS